MANKQQTGNYMSKAIRNKGYFKTEAFVVAF